METKWVNVTKELSAIASLEVLLFKKMLTNVSREESSLEALLDALRAERGLEEDQARDSFKKCQVSSVMGRVRYYCSYVYIEWTFELFCCGSNF